MIGDRYLELGCKKAIRVHRRIGLNGDVSYKIFQGNKAYPGRFGDCFAEELIWHSEDEAQAFLDHVARVRMWKKAPK